MFVLAAFVVVSVGQELWRGAAARRHATGESPPVALGRLVRRNRRRYGGYIAHAGLAVMLVGVAASSSFAHSQDTTLRPGQTASVGGYTFRYVRPTVSVSAQRLAFGAVMAVTQQGRRIATLDTARGYYPANDISQGVIGRFFTGESDSDVGLRAGFTRDLWTVINPDLTPLQGLISQGDKIFEPVVLQAMTKLGAEHVSPSRALALTAPLWQKRDEAVAGIAQRFVTHPWAVQFRIIVSPLVTWLWLGALIIAAGGLIALWPLPARSRVPAGRRSRLTPAPPAPAPPASVSPAPGPPAPAPTPAGAASLAVSDPV
jgi:cytochrome c-type biogenesis protein CcmF